jgi:hypothetical protein
MINYIKISLTLLLLILFCFPVKSNQSSILLEDSLLDENTIEFEITNFTVEKDQFEDEKFGLVKTIYFSIEFKAKRNNVWLPCEYDMCFYASSKKVECSQYKMNAGNACSWKGDSGLPPLDEIETKLRPEENTKAGKILAQKIKEKGFTTLAQTCLDMVTNPSGRGCLKFQ